MKFLSKFFFPLLLLLASCFLLKKDKTKKQETAAEKPILQEQTDVSPAAIPRPKKDSIGSITISAVGDLMCHITQYTYAKTDDGKYDFNPSFAEVKNFLSEADFAIGNLETTTAGAALGYSGYPNFNSPDEYAEALKNAGFDLLVTSNNHSMDMGEKGLLRTIEVIKKNNLSYTGTYISQRDRDSLRVYSLKGIKLALLNYTYGTNGILPSAGKEWMLNIIDTALIEKDILLARRKGAEIVLVFFHYGSEYATEPSEAQKFIVNKTIHCGADIILGAHTHVLQPMEFFKTKKAKLDKGFIAWSLGNFISNQKDRYCDAGAILSISLTKNFTKDSIWISEASYIPTWVYRGTNPVKKKHIIFPSEYCLKDSLPAFIDDASKTLMKRAYEDACGIITKRSAEIKIRKVL